MCERVELSSVTMCQVNNINADCARMKSENASITELIVFFEMNFICII